MNVKSSLPPVFHVCNRLFTKQGGKKYNIKTEIITRLQLSALKKLNKTS